MALKDRLAKHFAIGVIIISTVVMSFILYELSQTKENFGRILVNQSADRVHSELNQFFLPIKSMMLTLRHQQELSALKDLEAVNLNRYFVPIIQQYSQISSIGIADSRGYEFNIIPDSTTNEWLNREVFVDEWGMKENWMRWNINTPDTYQDLWEKPLKNDPRDRPWFKNILRDKESSSIYWTEPYQYMTGELGLTASISLNVTPKDSLLHILAIDITLKDLTKFSRTLQLTENDKVFILTYEDNKILGLPRNYNLDSLSPEELRNAFLSTPEEFSNKPLVSLLTHSPGEVLSFRSNGERWWGQLKTYAINKSQKLQIAVLIPESDFANEINHTRNVMIIGFLIILLLSIGLLISRNKLSVLSKKLNLKNDLITRQKERLFAEVHHRVKNNLAVMSALLELELMETEQKNVRLVLDKTQKRIKSMATVHEVMYQSDDMNRVKIDEVITGIIKLVKRDLERIGTKIIQEIEPIPINVNQALTLGLLFNECLTRIIRSNTFNAENILSIKLYQKDLSMVIEIEHDFKSNNLNENEIGKQLISVLVSQLNATMNTSSRDKRSYYQIVFELKDVKGIASNLYY